MDEIRIKYRMVYAPELRPGIVLEAGLPESLGKAKIEYDALIEAFNTFIERVNAIPNRRVKVHGGIELDVL